MEDFVSFDLAKKLKEKGFNEPCRSAYFWNNKEYELCTAFSNFICFNEEDKFYPEDDSNPRISAPPISQVLKWLREEKEIDIVISPIDANTVFMGGEKYILSVFLSREREYKLHQSGKDRYVKWEQAALAGIEYVLDNFI